MAAALSEVKFVVAALALLALTLALDTIRFETDPRMLAENLDFSAGLANWTTTDTGAVRVEPGLPATLILRQAKGEDLVTVHRDLPMAARYRYLRIGADYRIAGVVPGDRDWYRARIVLVGLDRTGEPMWRPPHHLFRAHGSRSWRHVEAVFFVPRRAHAVRLMVQLAKVPGELRVRNLTLNAAREGRWTPLVRIAALSAWAGLAVWAAWRLCARGKGRRWRIAGAAALLGVALLPFWFGDRAGKATPLPPWGFLDVTAEIAAAPPKPTSEPAPSKADAAPKRAPPPDALSDLWRDAEGWARQHSDWLRAAAYAVLAVLLLRAAGAAAGIWRPALYIAYPAVAAEVVQALPRDFFGWDDLVDLLAAVAGIGCAMAFVALQRQRIARG